MTEYRRGPVAFEGIATIDNRYVERGEFTWDDLPLPIVDNERQPLGRIVRIERVDDAIIATAEFDGIIPDQIAVAVDAAVGTVVSRPGRLELYGCRIRGCSLTDTPAWPGTILSA